MNESVLDKVRKLLAIADKSNYPEEAMSAMLKAQEFMAKHGITTADIEIQKQEKVVTDGVIEVNRRNTWWKNELVNIIAQNFRCHPYINRVYGKSTSMCLIGLDADVKLAKEVYLYAVEAIKYHSKKYIHEHKEYGVNTKALKNDYIIGFLNGLKDKFKEQVSKLELSLVLVKDPLVEQVVEDKKLKRGRKPQITSSHNEHARISGYKQGKDFNHESKLIENVT